MARQELVDRSREGVRHMVGKRHGAGFDLDQFAAGDAGGDAGRVRMGVRVGHRRDHQGRTAYQRQARFHHVAADDAMAFGGARPRLQCIDDEALEKIAEFIKPGSSVIITDNGISHETGKGTDYVILTH